MHDDGGGDDVWLMDQDCVRDNRLSRGRVASVFALMLLALGTATLLAARLDSRAQTRAAGPSAIAPHLTARQRLAREEYFNMRRSPRPIPPLARTRAIQQMRSLATPFDGLAWQFIGPQPVVEGQGLANSALCDSPPRIDVSGRVTAIKLSPQGLLTLYLGTANGGLWKSVDGGRNWSALTDTQPSLAVGALAVLANPQTGADTVYR